MDVLYVINVLYMIENDKNPILEILFFCGSWVIFYWENPQLMYNIKNTGKLHNDKTRY